MGRPDRTRRALLDAAVTVLTKDGSASLAEVASVAGVGRTTLHRYYPTREGLIRALVEDALDRVADAIASAHPEDGPVLEALQRVSDTVVPLGPSLAFLHAEPDQYNARDLIRRWYDALEPVAGAVERGQADGSIRGDLPVKWIVDAYSGLILTAWDVADEGRIWLHDAPRLVMTTLLGGIANPKADPGTDET
ncbi:MAG: TetR/AcrR family transcriptional regulator [Actinomycetes bacterium]